MNIYYYKKIHIDIPRFWKEILKMTIPVVIAFIIGIGLNRILMANNYFVLLIKIIIYTCVYTFLVWKLGMNDYEEGVFLQPAKKITNKIKG